MIEIVRADITTLEVDAIVNAANSALAGGGDRDEPAILRRTYERAFAVAIVEGTIRSIAFPAISTGAYAFPKRQAAGIALGVMQAHVDRFDRIVACLFDEESVRLHREQLANT